MCNTPEDLNLEGIDTVAVDIETYDPNLKSKGLGATQIGRELGIHRDSVYRLLKKVEVMEVSQKLSDCIPNKKSV